jgi:hypothetical protein
MPIGSSTTRYEYRESYCQRLLRFLDNAPEKPPVRGDEKKRKGSRALYSNNPLRPHFYIFTMSETVDAPFDCSIPGGCE